MLLDVFSPTFWAARAGEQERIEAVSRLVDGEVRTVGLDVPVTAHYHFWMEGNEDFMQTMSFASSPEFRTWLAKNHSQSDGLWLRIYKKNSSVATVTYAEALDQALCFGWIDGQKEPFDKQSWLQKFAPRRAKSGWSKINTQHAERLIKSGKMAPAGLREIEAAKADGRWKAAYDSFSNANVPDDFLKELAKNKKAKTFFETLNKTNLYSIAYRLQTAKKPETREKRIQAIIKMLGRGEKFH